MALTGAEMSVESGILPFRGKGALWEKIDPDKTPFVNDAGDDIVPGKADEMIKRLPAETEQSF